MKNQKETTNYFAQINENKLKYARLQEKRKKAMLWCESKKKTRKSGITYVPLIGEAPFAYMVERIVKQPE